MNLIKLICFLFFFALCQHIEAQNDSTMQLTKQQWQEISEGVDYNETYKEMERKDDNKSGKKNYSMNTGFDLGNFKYIIYFLILGLVIFLIVKVVINSKKNTVVKEQTITIDTIEQIEEKMHEVNLQELLKEALKAKNYRIALRLNFLIIIKLLSQKGEIQWAKEKTNWEYYSELQDKLLADQFKEIIISFESFWYGEHPLTELEYHFTEPAYQALQKRLSPHA